MSSHRATQKLGGRLGMSSHRAAQKLGGRLGMSSHRAAQTSAELSDTGGIKVLKWKSKCSSWNLHKIKNIIS
jgi:hypothetical protein